MDEPQISTTPLQTHKNKYIPVLVFILAVLVGVLIWQYVKNHSTVSTAEKETRLSDHAAVFDQQPVLTPQEKADRINAELPN